MSADSACLFHARHNIGRTSGLAQGPLADAADEHLKECPMTMRADDHKTGMESFRFMQNDFHRRPCQDQRLGLAAALFAGTRWGLSTV